MKTIQDYFRELDQGRLIEQYLQDYPIDYETNSDFHDMTVREVQETVDRWLCAFIERLKDLPVTQNKNGKQYVFYVTRVMEGWYSGYNYCLSSIEEIERDGADAPSYAYEFAPQVEIMGYLVADTPLTRRNIYGLAASVMYEASYFGYDQEFLGQKLKQLEESMKQAERDETIPWRKYMEQAMEERRFELDKQSEDEKELEGKVSRTIAAYNRHSKAKEIAAILEVIHGAK